MSKPFILLGDSTDHGGAVLEGSPYSDIEGKPIARVGDKVSCPIPGHGVTVIATGDATCLIDGKPVARHGDKTACGATLIASQTLVVDKVG
ncbi:putative Zn-binding protein involved in type VI secretion [Chitinivorax tropicus]|uniref:Putative Zn-binding protein involved in type VI secretion n=1 Tax=Chitinivorax tropicus TaxID=714531 RepID=A0A840MJQ9_9PROT|nr:PAAR domain-containing protein [Chitinivorax tropicus]MBB5017725.1 putative Zn-binding protein involved in type VI secretion [Chitinivorax tropicus]